MKQHSDKENSARGFGQSLGGPRSAELEGNLVSREVRLLEVAEKLSLIPWHSWRQQLDEVGTIIHTPFHKKGLSSTALKCPIEPSEARLANFWHVSYLPCFESFPPVQYVRSGTPVHFGVENCALRNVATERNIAELHRSIPDTQRLLTIDLQSPDTEYPHLALERTTVLEKNTHLTHYPDTISLIIPTHERGIECSTNRRVVTEQRQIIDRIVTSALDADHVMSSAIRQTLATEVSEILKAEEAGQISTVGRYALTARVLMLGWMAGMTPHFNCRSGKDRTGLVDVEVKFLYYQLTREMAGYSVSRLGEPRQAHEESAWRSILLNGGNHEIQEYNTGYRGSKLDHSSLHERIGAENWREFIGDSHLADV